MHWSLRMESPAIVSGLEEGMLNRSCSAPQLHAVRWRRSTSLSGFGEKPYKTPPDSRRCTLCDGGAAHGVDAAAVGGRADAGGMGPWMLVRVSAITNAWIHEQCARWSPEVYELGDSLQVR